MKLAAAFTKAWYSQSMKKHKIPTIFKKIPPIQTTLSLIIEPVVLMPILTKINIKGTRFCWRLQKKPKAKVKILILKNNQSNEMNLAI